MLTLKTPVVVRPQVTSTTLEILEIQENLKEKTVKAFVKYCDNPYTVDWITVLEGEDYIIDWTQEDVDGKVISHFESLLSGESSTEAPAETFDDSSISEI